MARTCGSGGDLAGVLTVCWWLTRRTRSGDLMVVEDEFATGEVVDEEYEGQEEDRRKRGWLPWFVLLVVLMLIAWLICRYSDFGRAPDQEDAVGEASIRISRVPDIEGLTNEEAVVALEAAGFEVEVETSFDAVAPPGTVVSQDPPAGERAAIGSTVFISVVAEAGAIRGTDVGIERESRTRVPDAGGLTSDEARAAIEADGFNVSVSEVYSASVPKGMVVDQTPAPGAAASKGQTVGLIVSLGAEPEEAFTVPTVNGLTKDAAIARIRAAGLEPRVMYQPNQPSVGRVYEQSPAPGTEVPGDRFVFVLVGAQQ